MTPSATRPATRLIIGPTAAMRTGGSPAMSAPGSVMAFLEMSPSVRDWKVGIEIR
jgi:hypothetical protein